ncbi:HlyD family efflux transporter periplasmic adaptor subunit [Commensalibacter nepenthis]|uniref:HlyD family efflux transporter periplasmic adaptor subunit n=1 Tax=Commensalibacter nepenthis TaxID=3043872 RepID=A0ABT6Q6Z2_9PROT|nr:HlyD family efflux transporter periplasmic adaptor subunit [Commensalibacter sp. TBRC 10068]MDI2112662.1 HlyD family efflux transporter periplasmic adaptor subunit [Commensalibacter sp. TBRC 10068]
MSSLFRSQALSAKKDAWLGNVQDIQPISVRIICIASFLLTILFVLYFYYGSYTRRVHAVGNVMPSSGLVTIGSRVNGIITKKNIVEGQFVKKNDVLFVISVDSNSISGPTQEHINNLLKQQEKILNKQIEIKEQDAPIEKNNIFNSLSNLQKQHNKVTEQINKDNEIIPLIQSSLVLIQKAKKLSLATNQEYQSQLFTYAQILSTHAQFLQNQTTIEGQILDNVSKIKLFDNKRTSEVNELKKQLLQTKQQIIESEKQQNIYITAPIDGKITAVRGYIGQQIEANMSLASIIPKDDPLDAELYVSSSSIGFLKKQQVVILRYDAFPYQKFGFAKGIITEITYSPITSKVMGKEAVSEQLVTEFTQNNSVNTDHTLYRIRVRPTKEYILADGKIYYLHPGMRVQADIAVDNRKLYQWMFKPVIQINDTIQTILMK